MVGSASEWNLVVVVVVVAIVIICVKIGWVRIISIMPYSSTISPRVFPNTTDFCHLVFIRFMNNQFAIAVVAIVIYKPWQF